MSRRSNLELAKHAAAIATKAGAKEVRAKVSRSREVSVEWRDGKVDRIRESTTQGLSVALFVDGRYAAGSTSDLRDGAIEKYLQDAVAAARYLAPDEHRHLPDPVLYEGVTRADLQLVDPSVAAITATSRVASARGLEEAARAAEGSDAVISVTSWAEDTEAHSVCFNTNGFEGDEVGTNVSRGVEVSVRDEGDRKPEGYAWGSCRFVEELPAIETLGREAVRRALEQRGSRQVPTGRYDLVVENRTVGSLARHLLSPLSGGSLQQKRSFFEGKLGEQVAAELLTLRDEPHLPRGLGSTAWDSEGMATRSRPVIERGVLRSYFLDTYYAAKLGMQPTSGGPANLVWSAGSRDAAAMVASMQEGIFVTGFLGGNSNPTTGDFSLGIKGFYVKAGKLVHPVSEMNMAGNHMELWRSLAELGNDPWPYSSNRVPSLRFAAVQCSGA